MKHLSEYTREEICTCLHAAGIITDSEDETEDLRNRLNSFSKDGDAPLLEELDEYLENV